MDAHQKPRRGRKPSARSDGNGQVSQSADRARVEGESFEESVVAPVITIDPVEAPKRPVRLDWASLDSAIALAQSANRGRRIVRVWHPSGPDVWRHEYCNAPVEHGDPAYQFNDGEIVPV